MGLVEISPCLGMVGPLLVVMALNFCPLHRRTVWCTELPFHCGWSFSEVYTQMVKSVRGPLDFRHCTRIQERIFTNATTQTVSPTTARICDLQRSSKNCDRGNSVSVGERCHNLLTLSSRSGILQQCLCDSQERRRLAAHYQSTETQQLHLLPSFQDGKYLQSQRRLAGRGVACKDKSKRCLLNCSSGKRSSKIPSLSVARKNLSI